MYTLYWSPFTGAFAPQAVLEEIGADYELVELDLNKGEHREPAYLAINPMGQIPALKLPTGSVVTESAAILLTLADLHPEAKLIPSLTDPLRAQAYRWMVFLSCNVYETALRENHPEWFTIDPNGVPGVKASALQNWKQLWQQIEPVLDPFMLGELLSVADFYWFMLLTWYPDQDQLFAECPRIQKAYELLRIRPAVEKIWGQHNIQLEE